RVGEVCPARPVGRLARERLLCQGPRLAELVLSEEHPGLRPQRVEVGGIELERAVDRCPGVSVPRRVARLPCGAHGLGGRLDQLRDSRSGEPPLSPDGRREEGHQAEKAGERQEGSWRPPRAWKGSIHDGSPGSMCRRFRPSNGLGRNGKSGVMPFSFTPTPSPTKFWM